MKKCAPLFLVLTFFTAVGLLAQHTPFHQWTFLDKADMSEIIGEASGETALHHVIEMVGYQRNRPAEEFSTVFREGDYVLKKLQEYGIEGAEIERVGEGESWDGIKGELWEVSPFKTKLADYDDVALMLASGSTNTDVTAELIWVEEGQEKDFEGLDVNGKIVVTSGYVSRVHRYAVKNGALGVIAYGSSRPLQVPLAIPSSGIWGDDATFGFYLPPREGHLLRDRLLRGEKITVHAVVEAEKLSYDLQVPTCVIPGTDPNAGEIILSAHIYEGYTKQGANDNVSGSAAILEVARMLHQMFEEGRLERPKRSIRFIWVPEFSGTIPWVDKHKDIMENTLCNINLDMVGINLKHNNSFMCLKRTTYGNPHYLNDVMENFYRFVGESSREELFWSSDDMISNRVVAPSGSDDPFLFGIDVHSGGSDHEVFNNWTVKVPGIMMITWPDLYYHTSEDLPNKLDPTQLKRTIVIAAAGAYTIASADEDMAAKIAAEVFSNASKRMGHQLARGLDILNKTNQETILGDYKKATAFLNVAFKNEESTINTVTELLNESSNKMDYLKDLTAMLKTTHKANLTVLEKHMEITAERLGMKPVKIVYSDLEKEAKAIVPKLTSKVKESEYGVERGMRDLSEEVLEKYSYRRGIANTGELTKLIDGNNSVLDMKQMLDTQYNRVSDIQSILNYLELLKIMGLVEM